MSRTSPGWSSSHPNDTGIRQARAKTDRLDARTLAKLLWAGELDGVWAPDERVRVMRRRLARRAQLVRARSRVKNEIHAVLMRGLKDRPPAADLFGVKGRRWLAEQQLALCERETVDAGLRHVDFLDTEIAAVDQLETRVDGAPPRVGDREAIEQLAAGVAEQIRDRARVPEGHQRRVDAVLQRRAMADQMQPIAGQLTLAANRRIR